MYFIDLFLNTLQMGGPSTFTLHWLVPQLLRCKCVHTAGSCEHTSCCIQPATDACVCIQYIHTKQAQQLKLCSGLFQQVCVFQCMQTPSPPCCRETRLWLQQNRAKAVLYVAVVDKEVAASTLRACFSPTAERNACNATHIPDPRSWIYNMQQFVAILYYL